MKALTDPTDGQQRPFEWRAAIRVTRRFSAPPERVFNAWLDPEVAGQWLFATALRPMTDVAIDPRVGGSFRLAERWEGEVVEHTGEYIEIVPNRRLAFNLCRADRPHATTRVTVSITPLNTGCELDLTNEQMPLDDLNYVEGRWTGMLYGLGVALDSRSDQ